MSTAGELYAIVEVGRSLADALSRPLSPVSGQPGTAVTHTNLAPHDM